MLTLQDDITRRPFNTSHPPSCQIRGHLLVWLCGVRGWSFARTATAGCASWLLGAQDAHLGEEMQMGSPWTEECPDELCHNTMQSYWQRRTELHPDN
ncbi:hypothetical protein ACWEV3_01010 [Saccharopolyspora sp. NPDC003752]